jgi:hypothetical protein
LIDSGLLENGATIFGKLAQMNFEIAANTTIALSMMRYVVDAKMAQNLVDTATTAKYILTPSSALNLPHTLKRLSG